jgi:hypothetical protein
MSPAEGGSPQDVTQFMGPSSMHEEAHVLKRELIHLRDDVDRVKAPRTWCGAVASAAFAIGVTALFAGLGTLGVNGVERLNWLRPTFFISAAAGIGFAVLCWLINWRLKDDFTADMSHVKRRVNELIDISGKP